MADLAVDDAAVVPFVQAYGDRLAAVVCRILRDFGRRDLVRDDGEVAGLVWTAAFTIRDRAGSWKPGGAAPWSWAFPAIRAAVAREIGHARADVDVDRLIDVAPAADRRRDDVDLDDLAHRHAAFALLRSALGEIGGNPRHAEVHLQYGVQKAMGDPSPAITVGTEFGLSPDNVRQIDRRVRTKVIALAGRDDRFADLRDLPWLTSGRPSASTAGGDAKPGTAAADRCRPITGSGGDDRPTDLAGSAA
jgi:hypothetical protein